jgi:hypothetical protein
MIPTTVISVRWITRARRAELEADPASGAFSDHARWLVRAYAGCLVELHAMYEIDRPFTVGFLLSENVAAECEQNSEDGLVYYLNPCVVGKTRSKRKCRKANRYQILAAAAHEFIHGGLDERYHDEGFAGGLTAVMARVLAASRDFGRHLA